MNQAKSSGYRKTCLNLALGLALIAPFYGAFAQAVVLYNDGAIPAPSQIAAILNGRAEPAAKWKTRGVKLLDPAPVVAAQTGDCDPVRVNGMKIRGIRTLGQATADCGKSAPVAETAAKAPVSPDCAAATLSKTRGVRLLDDSSTVPAPAKAEVAAVKDCPPAANVATAPQGASGFAVPLAFNANSTQLAPQMLAQLDAVAEGIKQTDAERRILLIGHTDPSGNENFDLFVSVERAFVVRDYLVQKHGIPASRLKVVGMGTEVLLNKANVTAAENRRVEFRADVAGL